jgi:hypothetical protein
VFQLSQLRLQFLPDALVLLLQEVLLATAVLQQLLLLAVHECTRLQHGPLHVLYLHLSLGAQLLDLVLQLNDHSLQFGVLDSLLIVGFSEFCLAFAVLLFEGSDLAVELLDAGIEFLALMMPLSSLLLLAGDPSVVFLLELVDLSLQLVDVVLVEPQHLLHLEVEGFDLLVLGGDVSFEGTLLGHDLLHVEIAGLQELVVGDVGEGGLGGVTFNLLLALRDHVLQLLLDAVMRHCELSQSQLVLLPQLQPLLHLSRQLLTGLLEQCAQGIDLKCVITIAILHLAAQTLEICIIQLRNLDFGEFNLAFVVLDDVFDLMLELVVVFLDLLQPRLLVPLEIGIQVEQALDFLLLSSDHCLQDGDVRLVVATQIGLSLGVHLAFLGELRVVVGGEILHADAVAVVVVLDIVAQDCVVVDEAGDLCLALLPSALEAVVGVLDLVLLLLDFVGEALQLGLVEVAQVVLVLLVLAEQVVADVFVLGLDKVQLVCLLLIEFLEFVAAVVGLRGGESTSCFISSLLRRSWRVMFSISKFFSSMVSLSLRMLSSWISELPFWERRRFWICAMDSLSYWFLRRCISSFLMLSNSTASFWRRVI